MSRKKINKLIKKDLTFGKYTVHNISTNKKFMQININGNKERQVTIISFDKQGKMVMQEMSQTRYFIFKIMKKINTKKKLLNS